MSAPFELVVGPVSIYTAPVNEARPDLEDAPAGNWVLLGTNGANNYDEAGVGFDPQQTIEEWYALGSTGVQQAFRTQERFTISVTLADMTAEHLAEAMNAASVTDTPAGSGTAGVRDFDILRGADVDEMGVLARWDRGPYITASKMQIWVPRAYVESMGQLTAEKGTPMMTEIVFSALEHSTNGYGKFEMEDEQAS